MDIQIQEHPTCDVIQVGGKIDSYTALVLENAFKERFEKGRCFFVLDASQVNFISSAGWWTLIRVQRECRQLQRGEVVLNGLAHNVRESMQLAGIEEFFRLFTALPDALASFQTTL